MELSMHASRNGLFATVDHQKLIANNLANIETPAYKRMRQTQSDFRFPGTQVASTQSDFRNGDLHLTNVDLDIAIQGSGFLKVDAGGTEAYTRSGNLHIDRDGNLVTSQGYKIDPPITFPSTHARAEISSDGTVYSISNDGVRTEVGQLEATRFQNPLGLVASGDNLFREGPNSGTPISGNFGDEEFPSLHNGFLEESNVDLTVEMTDQIVTQRTFQANLRAFRATDQIISETINILR